MGIKWISAAVRQLKFPTSINRHSLSSEHSSTSLNNLISKASESYIRLELAKAKDYLAEAVELWASAPPYATMNQDGAEIFALDLMIQAAGRDFVDNPLPQDMAMGFLQNKAFNQRLSFGVRSKLAEASKETFEVSRSLFPSSLSRITLNGSDSKFPLYLQKGRYLLHVFHDDKLAAYWIDVIDKNNTRVEEIKTQALWNAYPLDILRAAFQASRLAELKVETSLSVFYWDEFHQTKESLLVPRQKTMTLTTTQNLKDLGFDLPKTHAIEEVSSVEGSSIFRSPIFWTITGIVVAGLIGWGIYEATNSSSARVHTP